MRYIPKPYVCGILFSGLLTAQTSSALELEEIVVTAQKRQQSANDIGIAISTISGDALKELGVANSKDLALVTPGLTYSDSGGGPPVYTLRGVGFNDISYNAGSTVGVYLDEAGFPFPLMTLGAMIDVERVEVLKGPQGTLYGRNNTGGAINYIANKPNDEFSAGVTASYGKYENVDIEGYVNGALTESTSARLAVKTNQSSEGWQENDTSGETLGEKDLSSIRLSLSSDLSESVESLLQLSWWRDRSDTQAPQLLATRIQVPSNSVVAGLITQRQQPNIASARSGAENAGWTVGRDFQYDLEFYSASAKFDVELNDNLQMISLTQYARLDDNGSLFNRDGFSGVAVSDIPQPFPGAYLTMPDVSGLNGGQPISGVTGESDYLTNASMQNDATLETFSQEFRLVYETDGLMLLGGVYYANDKADTVVDVITDFSTNTNALLGNPALNFGNSISELATEADIYGLFVHSEWDIRDDLRLTASARYSEDKTDFVGCTSDSGRGDLTTTAVLLGFTPQPVGECATFLGTSGLTGEVKDNLTEDSVSWRFGIDWFVDDSTLLYASYSRGFKAGSFPNLTGTNSVQYVPATQERLDAWELGFKSTLAEGSVQFNGSVFYYDYKDKQFFTSVADPLGVFGTVRVLSNVPDSEVFGIEADVQWQPAEGLYISFGGSYLDTQVNDYTGTDMVGNQGVNFDGSQFPNTAKIQLNTIVNYSWPIADGINMYVGFDANYSDEMNADLEPKAGEINPHMKLDSYTLLNARIGVESDDARWRTYLWSRNLTNEEYSNNAAVFVDAINRYTGMPRTYGITVEYNLF